jgi:hypothetical protein
MSGTVLVVSGETGFLFPTASAERYDPAGGWSGASRPAAGRLSHTATLLGNGRVLVAGGGNREGLLASVELYDPATGTWATTAGMTSPRFAHTATLLTSGPNAGKVLVAGGLGVGGAVALAELYTP